MSYSIIFETKIVKLSDNRIIHFDRSGCNNDDCGRKKNDFTAKIYTVDEFVAKAEKYKQNSKPYKETGEGELKIGSKWCSCYDYGEHLLRMLRRAKTYSDFITENRVHIVHITGIEVLKPERKTMTCEEFSEVFYKLLYSGNGLQYRRLYNNIDETDVNAVANLIAANETLEITIQKR